jgi:two-component system chemotaxis sensor kinase CheA
MNLVQQGSDDPPQPWVLELTSTLQADEVAESLAFSIAPGHFRITVDHGQQDEGDFGLFLSASVGLCRPLALMWHSKKMVSACSHHQPR